MKHLPHFIDVGIISINLSYLKPALAFFMAALGIMMPPENFFAGIFLAISGAYFAAIWIPDKEKHELKQVIGLAVFVAIILAILDPYFLPDIPEQVKMALGGAFSRLIIRGVWRFAEVKISKEIENDK